MINVLFALPKDESMTADLLTAITINALAIARMAGREADEVKVVTTGEEFKVSFGRSRGWDDWPKVAVSRRNPLTGQRVYDMLLVKVDGIGNVPRAGLVGKTTGLLIQEAVRAGLVVAGFSCIGEVFRISISLWDENDYKQFWKIADADGVKPLVEAITEATDNNEDEDIF